MVGLHVISDSGLIHIHLVGLGAILLLLLAVNEHANGHNH